MPGFLLDIQVTPYGSPLLTTWGKYPHYRHWHFHIIAILVVGKGADKWTVFAASGNINRTVMNL